ncbi:hypothetical protein [Lacinutrix jangbogonensis]|uniref:hypothetical protein n=1 Tax=Lacinutrix jangbogonensis TaxID=1469557 RepID=UPI00053D64B0|nr:hypothetical protein [Lacinutrix jangbogonensis]
MAFDYDHPQGIQNVVLSLEPNGSYRELLIRYDLTDSEIESFRNNDYVNLEGKVTYGELEPNSFTGDLFSKLTVDSNCLVWDVTGSNCSGPEASGTHSFSDGAYSPTNTNGCKRWGKVGMATPSNNSLIGIDWGCIDGSTGGSYIPGTNTSPSSGQQSGAGQQSSQQGVSSGYAPTPEQLRQKKFKKLLKDNSSDSCFNNELTEDQQEEILNFLEFTLTIDPNGNIATGSLDSYSQGNMGFAEEAALAICGGGDFDSPNNVILHPTFKSNQKLNCVYEKLKGLSSTVFNDIINDHFDSAKNANVTFRVADITTGEDAETRAVLNPLTQKTIYNIVFDTNFVQNASTLELALTLIHESIHAELIERLVRLGLIVDINYINNQGTSITFTGSPQVFSIETVIFNQLLVRYNALPPENSSQWNHEFFNALSYRTKMAQNLVNIHTWLNDSDSDFLTNVNGDSLNFYGDFTIEQLMDYISWIGLEETEDFINNIQDVPLELTKKNFVEVSARTHYTNNCN